MNDNSTKILINREELAWAAGFFDGEGTTRAKPSQYTRGDKVRGVSLGLTVPQSERSVLERFNKATLNLGQIYGPYHTKAGKPTYVLGVHDFEGVQAVIAMLWSFLSEPKRLQAQAALQKVSEYQEWLSENPRKTRLSTVPVDRYCHLGHQKVQGRGKPWCPICTK